MPNLFGETETDEERERNQSVQDSQFWGSKPTRKSRGSSSRASNHPLFREPRTPAVASGNAEPEVIQEVVEVPVGSKANNYYYTPNYKNQVLIALGLAFVISLATTAVRISKNKSSKGSIFDAATNGSTGVSAGGTYLLAWAAIAVILFATASLRSTDKLAAAFAILILVAVIYADAQDLATFGVETFMTPGGVSGKKKH